MFKNVISLGFYCEVAKELERVGLRSASYPFDWLISSWSGVEQMIDTAFQDFLKYDDLYQYEKEPEKYLNFSKQLSFFHDFKKNKPLAEQMTEVKKKYERRIQRFYKDIKSPTLFIRYIESVEETEFWKSNYDIVLSKLQSFNKENQLWIINVFDPNYKNDTVFYVKPDTNDYIARHLFLEKIPELKNKLISDDIFDKNKRNENLLRYNAKQRKKRSLKYRIDRKIKEIKDKYTPREKYYIHEKIYRE